MQVTDGPNDQGEMFQRPARPSDKIPGPFRKVRLTEALGRLVQLYEATDNKDEAAKWRKELEEVQKGNPK